MVKTAPAQTINIFDRKTLRQKRARAEANFHDHDFLLQWAHDHLIDRLDDVNRDFDTALQIGTRLNKEALAAHPKINNLFSLDCIPHQTDIQAEEDFLPLKEQSLDLIFSIFNLHSVNDLPGALIQARRALKPDGLFLAAILGGETLYELRESLTQTELSFKNGLSPRVHPFADKQQMGALLQRAGFALPVIDSDIVTVSYDNMFKLLADIRGMGEGNIIAQRNRTYPGKNFFLEAARHYAENFSDQEGRITASFEVIFLIGWAPHESQQKPLQPGSAQTRLADALNTDEQKTGEKVTP